MCFRTNIAAIQEMLWNKYIDNIKWAPAKTQTIEGLTKKGVDCKERVQIITHENILSDWNGTGTNNNFVRKKLLCIINEITSSW